MKFVGKVVINHTDKAGLPQMSESVREAMVELLMQSGGRAALLISGLKGKKELAVPLQPPVCMYGHRVLQGQLGLRLLDFKRNPWDRVATTLQLTISSTNPTHFSELAALRDAINAALVRSQPGASRDMGTKGSAAAHRRPLAPRSVNRSAAAWTAAAASSSAAQADAAEEELPPLTHEQERALQLVKGGQSVFFTGSAGTGKSLLLQHIIRALPRESTFVTGTTGLSASQLAGTTINSFAGIGRGEGSIADLVRSAARGESGHRWRKASALIIDEISMMDGKLFNVLEKVARSVRGSDLPFGGIQLVLSGDFHQLPPVHKGDSGEERKFCFEADAWPRCMDACVQLQKVFRQSDGSFVDLLGKVRAGELPAAELRSLLARCARLLPRDDGILPTQLFTHRADVDAINDRELSALPGESVRFVAQDDGDTTSLAATCPAKQILQLKLGAQVMLIRNISAKQGLCNGARGVVEAFTRGGLPVVRFANGDGVTVGRERWAVRAGGRVLAQRCQLPLTLGWAITVHKSQGLTLDRVEVSLDRAFEPGMAYVALSRVRSIDGLRVLGGISAQALRADPKVKEFYTRLQVLVH